MVELEKTRNGATSPIISFTSPRLNVKTPKTGKISLKTDLDQQKMNKFREKLKEIQTKTDRQNVKSMLTNGPIQSRLHTKNLKDYFDKLRATQNSSFSNFDKNSSAVHRKYINRQLCMSADAPFRTIISAPSNDQQGFFKKRNMRTTLFQSPDLSKRSKLD